MAVSVNTNPYADFYKASYGTIFGRPLPFNQKCDPAQRVYQDTMLKNNTIVRITPGKYFFDKDKINTANGILEKHRIRELEIQAKAGSSKEIELQRLATQTQQSMVEAGVDMRYLTFEPDFPLFLRSFQLLVNKASTSMANKSMMGSEEGFVGKLFREGLLTLSASENAKFRGFNLWVEKSTSISESVSNSFTSSVFEGLIGKVSRWSREIQALTGETTGANLGGATDLQVETANDMYSKQMSMLGSVFSKGSSALSGAKVILPQIWDDSKFDRSYNVSFRFVSPYGDDRSVFMNVIVPFLFILSLALPRQDGPSGMFYPFLAQMDCPGYFSCQMGIVTSLSFTKGGSENLWNSSGLPLVIEGTFSVGDLYSALSLPKTNEEFATNLGTAAFVANLVGAPMYGVLDKSLASSVKDYVKGGMVKASQPINALKYGTFSLLRYAGLTEQASGAVEQIVQTSRF